jgi:hypothetical protein
MEDKLTIFYLKSISNEYSFDGRWLIEGSRVLLGARVKFRNEPSID